MTKTAAAISRRAERTKWRQNHILDAARACVLAEGFHAATISRIGAAAAMSKGHIYKYYQNKEEIMIALVEQHMHEFNDLIRRVDQSTVRGIDSLIDSFVRELPSIFASDRTSLWLEIQAEAARNPRVKKMATKSAKFFHETIRNIIKPVLEGVTKEELNFRADMLLIAMHGLGLQATGHSGAGTGDFATAVDFAFRAALSTPSRPEVARKDKAA